MPPPASTCAAPSAGLTYQLPDTDRSAFLAHLTRGWLVDPIAVVRSGFPFNATAWALTLSGADARPNLVAGQPLWLHGTQCEVAFGPVARGG